MFVHWASRRQLDDAAFHPDEIGGYVGSLILQRKLWLTTFSVVGGRYPRKCERVFALGRYPNVTLNDFLRAVNLAKYWSGRRDSNPRPRPRQLVLYLPARLRRCSKASHIARRRDPQNS